MTPTVLSASLLGAMLVASLLMESRMRLTSLVTLFRVQSAFLGFYALLLAYAEGAIHLAVIALLILALKAFVIPEFLLRVARASGASERLEAYVRPTTLSFAGLLVVGLAFAATNLLLPDGHYFAAAVSLSLVMLGFLLLVSRKDMFGQGIGFLGMENGIFIFGLALTGGMPLLVELSALFDLLILFILVAALVRRAQHEHSSVGTDLLRTLTD
ncbi:MAG: hypothetical protein KGI41_02660 [Patescibacteria group bacterium]|nr:hypothetical protein [Patescibacteria group bacterium]MDE1966117.1 hypothetical protein [Patescibacteria group bacterium]